MSGASRHPSAAAKDRTRPAPFSQPADFTKFRPTAGAHPTKNAHAPPNLPGPPRTDLHVAARDRFYGSRRSHPSVVRGSLGPLATRLGIVDGAVSPQYCPANAIRQRTSVRAPREYSEIPEFFRGKFVSVGILFFSRARHRQPQSAARVPAGGLSNDRGQCRGQKDPNSAAKAAGRRQNSR